MQCSFDAGWSFRGVDSRGNEEVVPFVGAVVITVCAGEVVVVLYQGVIFSSMLTKCPFSRNIHFERSKSAMMSVLSAWANGVLLLVCCDGYGI